MSYSGNNSAQTTKVQFDRPTVSEIKEIEKNLGGEVLNPSIVLVDTLDTPIALPPVLKYLRLSGPFKNVVTYMITQDNLVEKIRYSTMVSSKDSTLINALFKSDKDMINQIAGNLEKQSHADPIRKSE
ncbi:MAG: hypothetical protein V4708_01565 [Bacteroidota bacterium]